MATEWHAAAHTRIGTHAAGARIADSPEPVDPGCYAISLSSDETTVLHGTVEELTALAARVNRAVRQISDHADVARTFESGH